MTAPQERARNARTYAEPVSAKVAQFRIRALGACAITVGRTRINPDSSVLFALALYLGLRAGERVTRAEVLELLWPASEEQPRRHALRQLLYRLKRSGFPVDGDGEELAIDPADVDCDLSGSLTNEWVERIALRSMPAIADVFPAYTPGLSAEYDAWLDTVRTRCGAQIRRASLRHVALARREGRWVDLEFAARRCLDADPLNEEATLALAEAIAMGGSKAEAVRLLDAYLLELGEPDKSITVPARLLRRRISDQPTYRAPRAGEPPLIARADDIAWLNGRLDEAREGRIATAMLIGPPGIGKSAVVRTFVSHAEMRGWRFMESRLQPSDVDRPMSIFVELIPPLLKATGALGAAPESIAQLRRLIEQHVVDDILTNKSQEAEAVQARIRTSMSDVLGAVTHEGPLVLVLEDLHWVDKQSLRLLTWLLDHASEMPVLWLMSSRMEGCFASLREALPPERIPSWTVGPLEKNDAVALFEAHLGPSQQAHATTIPRLAYELTGGNPLFIREVAGHWRDTNGREELPSNLRELMRGRMSRLSATAQRVMHCCAMLGRFASVPRVSLVLEIGTTDLLACIEEVDSLGLLGLGGEPGSLVLHDLWQEELVGTLKPASRALLHLRCGEVLEREANESNTASILPDAARHLLASGAKDRGVRLLESAATYQVANGLSEDAVASLDLALTAAINDDECFRLEQRRLAALLTFGGWTEIAKSVDRALALGHSCGALTEAHSSLELIAVESTMVAEMDLWKTVVRADHCVRALDASDLHRATAARLGAKAASNLALAERLTFFATEVNQISRSDAATRAQILAVETVFHASLGTLQIAIQAADDLVQTERASGSVRGLIMALRYYVNVLRIASEYEAAVPIGIEAYHIATKHRLAEDAAAAADLLASTFFDAGSLSDASAWLDTAEPWIRRVSAPYARTSASICRAMIALESGEIEVAATFNPSDVGQIASDPTIRHRLCHLSLLARISAARHDRTTAQACETPLRAALVHARAFRRSDYFIASLATVVAYLDSPAAARGVVSDFSDPVRDADLKPWREFAGFYAGA